MAKFHRYYWILDLRLLSTVASMTIPCRNLHEQPISHADTRHKGFWMWARLDGLHRQGQHFSGANDRQPYRLLTKYVSLHRTGWPNTMNWQLPALPLFWARTFESKRFRKHNFLKEFNGQGFGFCTEGCDSQSYFQFGVCVRGYFYECEKSVGILAT